MQGKSRASRRSHVVGLLLATALLPGRSQAGSLDVDPEELRPGLLAAYRSLAAEGATLRRIEPKPAFCLGHSSPHPSLPPGPFEATWEGWLQVREPGPLSFRAFVCGELRIEVDGVAVLQGSGRSETSALEPSARLEREPGVYRVAIRYRSLAGQPARLQVFWESPSFAREPLPAWRLGHLPAAMSPAAKRDELAGRGRTAAIRLGCARCHSGAMPGLTDPPSGPSLADVGRRIRRDWLLNWLDDPAKVRDGARMPALFSADRRGFVERWLIAEYLTPAGKPEDRPAPGDHRMGRRTFLGLGCAACHLVPDVEGEPRDDPGRFPVSGLGDRLGADDLAAFLGNPRTRYPDGRMPRLPIAPNDARDIAAYLLLWSKPTPAPSASPAPTAEEVRETARRLGVPPPSVAVTLLREKGCTSCHSGLGASLPLDVPIKTVEGGCLAEQPGKGPRHRLDAAAREALAAYLGTAARETYPSPVESRQRQLERAGCVRCHQRDSDRPPPIEQAGASLGGAFLQVLPFQRTPRLTNLHQKFTRKHLATTVREGVSGLRHADYTYRMPSFGADAETLIQALAEADGELPDEADPPPPAIDDATLGTLNGPALVGSQGYSCISCHVWGGRLFSPADPGAIGPDLTRVAGRIRRDWFDRFLEDPARFHPGTPMPAIFLRGKPATLTFVLGGDSSKQKEALWAYFAAGPRAPAPKPPLPLPIDSPQVGASPLVAQIPIRLPDGGTVEAICVLNASNDLLIYDLATNAPHSLMTGARILRDVQGRLRRYLASGTPVGASLAVEPAWQCIVEGKPEAPASRELRGYDRLAGGVRIRWAMRLVVDHAVVVEETLRIERGAEGQFVRELRLAKIPKDTAVALRVRVPEPLAIQAAASAGVVEGRTEAGVFTATLSPDRDGNIAATISQALPAAQPSPAWEGRPVADPGRVEGSLERPGYRAIAYPRPKTISGEDRIMPAALAVHPKDGRVFVASLKTGEIHVLRDPRGDGKDARFDDYTGGLFQDALSMLAEDDALYVLHRRNLTRVTDTDGDGKADRFDRVFALPHGIVDTYDYGYGLVRDKTGAFILSYAQYADARLPGAGGALRWVPGQAPKEIAHGFRNPLGWCVGAGGEVFFTDNQGEWVAANKLCHLEEGRYYGFPNAAQPQHTKEPPGKAAVWVPYAWARSINGVTYDNTGGKFGPFAGQFFLAELMFGGAIIRADVERVNGQTQGACFPFWGKGLMGPVALAFGPEGHLYVGGITEPGWMAQPDRGALFRIDYTGKLPFEMRTIRARPRGFRIEFTRPVDREIAAKPSSYRLEHYRYEYTGSYGSPELDRNRAEVEGVVVSPDGRHVDLTTRGLVKDRVYVVAAPGVRSEAGEALVHDTGAYTLHEIPAGEE